VEPVVRGKKIVRAGYNKIASSYTASRSPDSDDVELVYLLIDRLPKQAMILDAGCGSGYPVTQILATHFRVTGVEFANEQIRRARENLPDSTLICADISQMPFRNDVFDGICSFYAIVHVPRQEHTKLLMDLHKILKTRGLALLCMGSGDLQDDITEWHGTELFWSHYDKETNLRMMKESGFAILWSKVVNDPVDPKSAHLFLLGQKL
jgi:SAM-dependent methyltransferase